MLIIENAVITGAVLSDPMDMAAISNLQARSQREVAVLIISWLPPVSHSAPAPQGTHQVNQSQMMRDISDRIRVA